MNILTLAHGHPRKHKGGGEVAAYGMHSLLQACGHQSVFVGWGGFESEHSQPYQRLNDHEYEIYTSCNFFDFSSASNNVQQALSHILITHEPNVVHLHHYVHVGIEVAALVKRLLPRCKVVLTLHEYLAICMNNGQLVTADKTLCQGAALERCVKCFPHHSEADFFRRRLFIQAALSYVDHFIAPSEFLRQRYIDWGLEAQRIHTIENPLPSAQHHTAWSKKPPQENQEWVLGFFGQINYYKGLDVVLDGVSQAILRGAKVRVNIHGKYSDVTGTDYIESLRTHIQTLGLAAHFAGPYQQSDVLALMSACHFVVMGSRWYENSPVVIREAIAAARPLIVPKLGGMEEKAQGLGMFFAANTPHALANLLCGLHAEHYQQVSAQVLVRAQQEEKEFEQNLSRIIHLYGA